MAFELADTELRASAIAGLAPQARALSGRCEQLGGILVAVTAAAPDRSLFNSVVAAEPEELIDRIDEVAALYDEAGIRAWTVWLADGQSGIAAELERRGHTLDGAPRLMALELADRAPTAELASPYSLDEGDLETLGRLNDLAYGYEGPAWRAALSEAGDNDRGIRGDCRPDGLGILVARHGEAAAACVGTIGVDDDLMITAVATDPLHQGRGLCSAVLGSALDRAAGQGFLSSSLQASGAGAGVYARLGYRDFGAVELWERRRDGDAPSARG